MEKKKVNLSTRFGENIYHEPGDSPPIVERHGDSLQHNQIMVDGKGITLTTYRVIMNRLAGILIEVKDIMDLLDKMRIEERENG